MSSLTQVSAPSRQPQGGRLGLPMLVVLAVVIFSGALFGYDQGVISGALDGIKREFGLGPLLVEVVTSWVTLGALVGALAGGDLADRFGRKKTVLAAGLLFALGALLQAMSGRALPDRESSGLAAATTDRAR